MAIKILKYLLLNLQGDLWPGGREERSSKRRRTDKKKEDSRSTPEIKTNELNGTETDELDDF